MAKGARASTNKANNAKLKSKVFGPVETARTERLSAKLLELASQSKPEHSKDAAVIELEDGNDVDAEADVPTLSAKPEDEAMDLDAEPTSTTSKPRRGRVEKRRSSRKAAIVFPKYKNGKRVSKSKAKK